MNKALLQPEVQEFISTYELETTTLALKGSPWNAIPVQELIQQIEGFRKTKDKLPLWHSTRGIVYPPKLNLEQTSSEVTAQYKAGLVSGKTLADITGGFGVDSYYFSQSFEQVDHFERNELLSEIANHNFTVFKKNNSIRCLCQDGLNGIQHAHYDVIYVDPSRRNESKGKVFLLSDCEPNVVENRGYLLDRCNTLLIKTSPMLDLTAGLRELSNTQEIHVVAVDNEVKELLWVLQKDNSPDIVIRTLNFQKKQFQSYSFVWNKVASVNYSNPKKYLFEPNAAIMKSAGFHSLGNALGLCKLAEHSHLFTADEVIDFPGRVFEIEQVLPYQKKEMKKMSHTPMNVATRNFPESVAQLRKKWKIKEGGQQYVFFTTLANSEKVAIVGKKVLF
ncbi:MAG: class I SAM-dependent methyltransferase [Flavobacteriaceae bacterium]